MALPINVGTGTVRGRIIGFSGDPGTGKMVFLPTPRRVLNTTSTPPTTILREAIVAVVDSNGDYEKELVATDNEVLNPKDWTWQASFVLGGQLVGEPFHFSLPTGADIDLTEVTPVSPSNGVPTVADFVKNAGGVAAIWSGTQAAYDAITSKSPTTLYIITEA